MVDAIWLADLLARGLIRRSFVPKGATQGWQPKAVNRALLAHAQVARARAG